MPGYAVLFGIAAVDACPSDIDTHRHNGWLEGSELKGIAVWFDRNENGVSDPKEVVSLDSLGVRRIATLAHGLRDGAQWNPSSVELRSGAYAATFDWTPTSVAPFLAQSSTSGVTP
jgi:hypothetical protein